MKGKYNTAIFLFFVLGFVYSQERTHFKGKVSNAMGAVVHGSIVNLNSKTRTTISEQGFFDILAQPKDTLLFASLACQPKKVILTNKNFDIPFLDIELQLFDNELKEVIILNQKEIHSTDSNSQKYVDRKYFDDTQSSPENPLMPTTPIPNGMDFVRIYKDLKKILKKKAQEKELQNKPLNFYKVVTDRVPTDFFTKTLHIKGEEILLFLSFCETDKRTTEILNQNGTFWLYDFLITKNEAFKNLETVQGKGSR